MRLPSLLLIASAIWAQSLPPVVTPRGIVNADSQQPAPSAASPGGLIWIHGLNLGPTPEVIATTRPLPKSFDDLEVTINGKPAALYSASLERIVAQVPVDILPGLATIVVRRGDQRSRPARINIIASLPSIRTLADKGYGPVLGGGTSGVINLTVSGLGPTDPALGDGEASADSVPKTPVRAYIGGWPASVVAKHTSDQPGAFTVTLTVPDGALPSDPVVLLQNGRRSNAAVLSPIAKSETQFMRLPDGTPELRTVLSADLRASFIAATGVRQTNGCFTGLIFDLAKQTSASLPPCLASDAPNAQTPFQQAQDGTALAAFIGPNKNANEVSDQVLLLNAVKPEPLTVRLPATSQLLVSGPDGNLAALLTGNQAVVIDANSGEVRPFEGPLGQLAGGAGGALAGAGVGVGLPAIDLGQGLNKVLTQPVGVGGGTRLTVVGDNLEDPTKAKIAGINAQNEVTQTRDFPDGWLPLAAPAAQLPAGPGGGQQIPANVVRLTVTASFDAPQRTYYVLARRADNGRHGLIAVRTDRNEVRAIEFPDGWFAAACTANIRFFNVELVRRFGLLASSSPDRAFSQACAASGFILFDLDEQKATAVPLPGAGQISATIGTDEMNDYIFGSNIDAGRQGTSDTLYVLDGVTASAFRVDLPPNINAFAQLRAVPAMNFLIGLATSRAPGDAGLVVFDLDKGQGTVFPTPEGFINAQIVDVFPATRKVVARGTRQGNTGTQFLVYDLVNGDLQIVDNPTGVAFIGAPAAAPGAGGAPGGGGPGVPGGGGQFPGGGAPNVGVNLRSNVRANAVIALTYDSDRKQNGVVALRLN